ncbi:MAG: FixH family protein [Pyrinomonadaceae bacterium]
MFSRIISFVLVVISISFVACAGGSDADLKVIADKKIDDKVSVAILNPEGKLKNGEQSIGLRFTDGAGKPIKITAAKLNFNMPAMGSMAEMNDAATLNTTETEGNFVGNVKLQMAGEWIAQISYEGDVNGSTTITLNAN